MLWLRTLLFTIFVPGTELVLIPWVLFHYGVGPRLDFGLMGWAGVVPILAGAAIIFYCFADFIRKGHGTPAPYDPPRTLVIVGLYRYVRNPQYVGVALVATGEALFTGHTVLFGYALLLALAFHLLVTYYEEPTLTRVFGLSYSAYCKQVSRWLPRRFTDRF